MTTNWRCYNVHDICNVALFALTSYVNATYIFISTAENRQMSRPVTAHTALYNLNGVCNCVINKKCIRKWRAVLSTLAIKSSICIQFSTCIQTQ